MKKFNIINVYLSILRNPFPQKESTYYDSIWFQWIERIKKGQDKEHERISKIADKLSEEEIDFLADNYWMATEVTNVMFAALMVAIWSDIEKFMGISLRICKLAGKKPFTGDMHKIGDVSKYFLKEVKIRLQDLKGGDVANAVRVLSNSFKHNGGRYKPDKFPIDRDLQKTFKIEEKQTIKYNELPIYDMLITCGTFCNELGCIINAVAKDASLQQ